MDEQQVSRVLAINKVKEQVDDLLVIVKELQATLKSYRSNPVRPSTTTASLLNYFGNSENKVLTEDGDVISCSVSSNSSKVTVEYVFADADTSVGRVFPVLQPMVTVDLYEIFSYLLDSKVAVVDWNGEISCESLFGVVKNIFTSRLPPVCENDSVKVLSLFVTKIWCCIQPLVIAAKPPPKPPDASVNMLGQTNQVLSIVSKISCDMFKSMVRFTGSSKKDIASTRCLDFVGLFVSVYVIELSRSQLASTECVKSNVFALVVVVARTESLDEGGTNISVGRKKGEKDEISYYVRHGGNNQWLSLAVMRSESKLLSSVRLERATGNTQWISRLRTNAIFNKLCKMLDPRELSLVPQKEKTSVAIFDSLQGSGKTTTFTRYAYYRKKMSWKPVLVFAAIQIVFRGCPHYVIPSVALFLKFSGHKLVLFMFTNRSTQGALLISYWAAIMSGIINFIWDSMKLCSCVLLVRTYYYFEVQSFGHVQRFFWVHGWSLAMGDAWRCKLNYKSSHICDHYRIGNMQRIFSVVLLMGEYSELMFQGVFSANVISTPSSSTLLGVLSKLKTYRLLQIIIKGIVDDRFLLSLTRIHCESFRCGCRQAMKQYHTFTNGLGLLGKCKTLFMPLDEAEEFFQNQADILSTSRAGQGVGFDYYSHQSTSRQLQTRMNSQFRMYWACTRKNFKSGLPLYDTERYTSLENQATQHIIGSINQQPLLHTTGKDFDLKKFLAVSPTYNFNINNMNFPPGAFLNTKVSYDQPRLFFEEGISILVSIAISPFSHLSSHVAKIKPPIEVHGSATSSKLQTATGHTYLETKRNNLAVYRLLGTDMELCNKGSEFVAPPGVTISEELCAIYEDLDWRNVKNEMINNSKFKKFLELVIEFKELINDLYSSHYTLCLKHPGNNKSNLVLDMWMLATAFRTTIIGLKKDFEASITDSQSQARIDSHNKVIFKRNFAWNLLTWRCEFFMFSLPRPPEVNDLEDKVVFEGRRM